MGTSEIQSLDWLPRKWIYNDLHVARTCPESSWSLAKIWNFDGTSRLHVDVPFHVVDDILWITLQHGNGQSHHPTFTSRCLFPANSTSICAVSLWFHVMGNFPSPKGAWAMTSDTFLVYHIGRVNPLSPLIPPKTPWCWWNPPWGRSLGEKIPSKITTISRVVTTPHQHRAPRSFSMALAASTTSTCWRRGGCSGDGHRNGTTWPNMPYVKHLYTWIWIICIACHIIYLRVYLSCTHTMSRVYIYINMYTYNVGKT